MITKYLQNLRLSIEGFKWFRSVVPQRKMSNINHLSGSKSWDKIGSSKFIAKLCECLQFLNSNVEVHRNIQNIPFNLSHLWFSTISKCTLLRQLQHLFSRCNILRTFNLLLKSWLPLLYIHSCGTSGMDVQTITIWSKSTINTLEVFPTWCSVYHWYVYLTLYLSRFFQMEFQVSPLRSNTGVLISGYMSKGCSDWPS